MEDKDLDKLIKFALQTNFDPDEQLNTNILQKVREKEMTMMKKARKLPAVAAACCLLLCCSATVFAAWKYLTPNEVATEYGNEKLAAAFEREDAIKMNEVKTYKDYTVTLLGAVSGKNLTGFCSDNQVVEERTYAVIAISKTDGTPMPATSDDDYGKDPFFISPLIQGLNPQQYNIMTMNGGYFEIVKEGIMYRMIECDNIQLFADRNLYLCVSDSSFYNRDAYTFDEKTGEISVNKSFTGMNMLFDFPLDKSKADKDEAQKYLDKFTSSEETVSQNETDDKDQIPDINEIKNNWTLISEKKVTPDAAGRIYFSYETEHGSQDGYITEDSLFEQGETGYSKNIGIGEMDGVKETILYYRDENGDVTVSAYQKLK